MTFSTVQVLIASGALVVAMITLLFVTVPRNRADRLAQVSETSWKIKEEVEQRLKESLERIAGLETSVRENADRMKSREVTHTAELESQKLIYEARMKADRLLYDTDLAAKDSLISKLVAKIDALELRLDQLRPVVTVTDTQTTVVSTNGGAG